MSYKYIIISNNDVYVPTDAIKGIAASLVFPEFPVVVPTTTRHACGHNPVQVKEFTRIHVRSMT
jgi:hypothetical protein